MEGGNLKIHADTSNLLPKVSAADIISNPTGLVLASSSWRDYIHHHHQLIAVGCRTWHQEVHGTQRSFRQLNSVLNSFPGSPSHRQEFR